MSLVQPKDVKASDGEYSNGTLVTWSYTGDLSEVHHWDIYRWKPGEAPQFYQSEFGDGNEFLDTDAEGAFYYYAVEFYGYDSGTGPRSRSDIGWTKATVGTQEQDTLIGGNSRDSISGYGGADVLYGMLGNDRLSGGAGFDDLYGGDGNDNLIGGSGASADYLWGGRGSDTFVFSSIKDSVVGRYRDQIRDYRSSEDDHIDLHSIDANTLVKGNQAFKYIGGNSFHAHAGELRFARGVLSGDVNGDGKADFEIRIYGSSLSKYDLVL